MYRLLIVEDEYEIRMGLCNYFPWASLGFTVVAKLENGQEALDYLLRKPVDVVLSDIKMPVVDGLVLARELYNQKLQIPIVFLSGYTDFALVREALVYGVRDYLVKPVKYHELVDTFTRIKQEMDKRRSESVAEEAPPPLMDYEENVINTIFQMIQSEYRRLSLEDVARAVHMNSSYLSRYIKEKTGKNFMEHLIETRMRNAREFLLNPKYKINDISKMVGYTDAKSFAHIFKKTYGISPSDFRKSML